ncbi:unnamed protein product [Rhodiola kirilowii]
MDEQEKKWVRQEIAKYEVFDYVIPYINRPSIRSAVSLVSKRWYKIDSVTRKKVNIDNCYSTSPQRLSERFPNLEKLKVKGKPWASTFDLLPYDWGGYVTPWVNEIVLNVNSLKSIHFRLMIVKDFDLEALAQARGPMLLELKLDKCFGFSTDGLLRVAQSCRNLKVFILEESRILDNGGQWLHEIAVSNTVLETLNFYMTDLATVDFRDLELISRNCLSLKSVKINNNWEIIDLLGFFRLAASLEEFCGGSHTRLTDDIIDVTLPATIQRLGLTNIRSNGLQVLFPLGGLGLTKLDLGYTWVKNHYHLIRKFPNLEVIKAQDVIGDRGLEALAFNCKKLKRLRIEHGEEGREGMVSHKGLEEIAQGCSQLEYLSVYVSDITNETLEIIGKRLKKLRGFRLVLADRLSMVTDLPLDNGVRALLEGCTKLVRFALYLRPGGLTDAGLIDIGKYSKNVKWMLLGRVGETDEGLRKFSEGCPVLEKLQMRGCCFSEKALAFAITQLRSLRFLWVQGYTASVDGRDLFYMQRPYWNIELIPATPIVPAQILAYYSLVGPRTDYPETVSLLHDLPPGQHP